MKTKHCPYSRAEIDRIRKLAMQVVGCRTARHIYPRAYCIAKPAPGCIVVLTPWMDSEPQIRSKPYSAAVIVREGDVADIDVGDWCSVAYVITSGSGMPYAFVIPERES